MADETLNNLSDTDIHWYVLYTAPQYEKKIATALEKKGIEVYLPVFRRKRKWSDRIKVVEFPLFPSYLFVRIAWREAYLSVLEIKGALDFVKRGPDVAVFPDEEMAKLAALVQSARQLESDPETHMPPGKTVRVTHGPLKGVTGVVARVKNKSRLFVEIPLLDRVVSAELDVIDVEPA